jgi:hypothetical protein
VVADVAVRDLGNQHVGDFRGRTVGRAFP